MQGKTEWFSSNYFSKNLKLSVETSIEEIKKTLVRNKKSEFHFDKTNCSFAFAFYQDSGARNKITGFLTEHFSSSIKQSVLTLNEQINQESSDAEIMDSKMGFA